MEPGRLSNALTALVQYGLIGFCGLAAILVVILVALTVWDLITGAL